MASILLVFAIAAMGVIVFWYVFDEATRGGQAKSGLLGMGEREQGEHPAHQNQGWRGGGNKPWRVRRH